jgi:RNA polymerase sigma-70 factor (ECF subfamily)
MTTLFRKLLCSQPGAGRLPADPRTPCSDEELLTRLRGGEREVFGILVRRYQRELYGYLRRYLGDCHLAEDVLQNTFLQLYLKSGQYEPGRPVRPWLYTIATRQAIDALRRSSRQQALSLDHTCDEASDSEALRWIDLVESRDPGPLDAAQSAEARRLIRARVDRLPDGLRQVLILAYYQGLKYREIAAVLGLPIGTVKSRLHNALVKLRQP